MRLYEYESKSILKSMELNIPENHGIIHSPGDLDHLNLTFPVMLKSMVLTGGRGKAGGIKKVNTIEDAKEKSKIMFDLVLKDYPVDTIMLEDVIPEKHAWYIGITTNPVNFNIVFIVSATGGVDIEKVGRETPNSIYKEEITDNEIKLPESIADTLASFLINNTPDCQVPKKQVILTLSKLYSIFQNCDCKVAEINPLIVTIENKLVAADAKIVLDDNALYRQNEIFELLGIKTIRHDNSEPTSNEIRAKKNGFTYVDLIPENTKKDPNMLYIGLVPGGAGYGIFSIDETVNIGEKHFSGNVIPVNFMDSGGGPSSNKISEMFNILMDNELVDIIATSRFGGISSCDIYIRGLIQCLKDRHAKGLRIIPIYGRMVGTDLPEAKTFLDNAIIETPDIMKNVKIHVGNIKIMADIIKDCIAKGFELKAEKVL